MSVTQTVEIGFAADPLDALSTVTWTDITGYLFSWSGSRGKQHELSQYEAGTETYVLNNNDGRFDPTNTSSPYYPNLLPGRRVRRSVTYGATTYTRFVGYVESWKVDWTSARESSVTLDATDAFGILNLVRLPASAYEFEVLKDRPKAWYRLGESSIGVAADSSGNRNDGQYQGAPTFSEPGLISGDDNTCVIFPHSNGSRVSVPNKDLISGYPFSVECWFRTGSDDRALSKQILNATNGPGIPTEEVSLRVEPVDAGKLVFFVRTSASTGSTLKSTSAVDNGAIRHAVVVCNSASSFTMYLDGATTGSMTATSATGFPKYLTQGYSIGNTPAVLYGDFGFSDPLDEVLIYDGVALSAARVLAHYEAGIGTWATDDSGERITRILDRIGWPSADRAIDTGKSTLQNVVEVGSVLSYFQKVAESEHGAFFISREGLPTFLHRHRPFTSPYDTVQASFDSQTPSGAVAFFSAPASYTLDNTDTWTEVRVTRVNGIAQTAVSSGVAAGTDSPRTLALDGLLNSEENEAKDYADWLLGKFEEPVARLPSITIQPDGNPSVMWPLVGERELGDRIAVVLRPPGAFARTRQAHVDRISESWDRDSDIYEVTYDLSAADLQTYWVLGTSALGIDTRLAF